MSWAEIGTEQAENGRERSGEASGTNFEGTSMALWYN